MQGGRVPSLLWSSVINAHRPVLRSLLVLVTAALVTGTAAVGPAPARAADEATVSSRPTDTPAAAAQTTTEPAPIDTEPEDAVPSEPSAPATPSASDAPATDPAPTAVPGPTPVPAPTVDPAPVAVPVPAGEPAAGDVVVGELVQGYADPGPAHLGEEHPADQGSGLLSWVQADDGETVRVQTDDVSDVEAGETIEVIVGGAVRDEATTEGLEPARDVLAAQVVAPADDPVVSPTTAPVNHEVTVVMMQPGGVARDATTPAQLTAAVNGPVGTFWEDQSGGAVRFGVTASYGWASTPVGCTDPFALWRVAAERAGWTPGPRKHLLVYVPVGTPGCSYGLGSVGNGLDDGGLAYVEAPATSVIAHEFGHNLGLGHSSAVQCDDRVESSSCRTTPYDDYYDVMGVSWAQVGTLNAPQADLLGVLPAGQVTAMGPTSPDATVTLAAASSSAGVQAVRLTSLDGQVYWLEYRAASGQDSWLGTSANWPGLDTGLQVRRPSDGDDTSLLLDASPSPASGWSDDTQVSLRRYDSLSVGRGGLDFWVTIQSVSSAALTIRVQTSSYTSPIEQKHTALGGPTGPLGAPTSDEVCGLPGDGCRQTFGNGSIYWSPDTGAHTVTGSVRQRWLVGLAGPGGVLGYPTSDTVCAPSTADCSQDFERGSLFGSASTPMAMLTGPIRDRFVADGGRDGAVGLPTSDTFCGLRGGGCGQHFQRGSLYWSPATGARRVSGAVLTRWGQLGWEVGALGYPTGDPVCGLPNDGCTQTFQGGSLVSSSTTGVRVARGVMLARWVAMGRGSSSLGYPTSDEMCGLAGGGCFQRFQSGTMYWSPATGARRVFGAVLTRWGQLGWEVGALGYPTGDPVCGASGRCAQAFQRGSLTA